MEKFVPFEKMSKKAQKEISSMKRKDWGGLSPVTRTKQNDKAEKSRRICREKVRSYD